MRYFNNCQFLKSFIVYVECPSTRFPEDVKKTKIELFAFKLAFNDGQLTQGQRNTAIVFNVFEELERQQICITKLRSNVTYINPDDGSVTICCPKLPKDTDARIGVRRNPQNQDKKQKIFGYNLVLTTSIELNRGYNQIGYPFAPCGMLCRPNGFDKTRQRLTFCCFKQCLKLRPKAMENLNNHYDIAN